MPNGLIQIGEDGKVMVASGEVGAADDCCSEAGPCICCKDDEPQAVITIECTGVNDCTDFEGTYPFKTFESDDDGTYSCCMWLMEMIADELWYHLYLLWYPELEMWAAVLVGRSGPIANRFGAAAPVGWSCNWDPGWSVDVTPYVVCSRREISGSFTLTGQDWCADCVASITIS